MLPSTRADTLHTLVADDDDRRVQPLGLAAQRVGRLGRDDGLGGLQAAGQLTLQRPQELLGTGERVEDDGLAAGLHRLALRLLHRHHQVQRPTQLLGEVRCFERGDTCRLALVDSHDDLVHGWDCTARQPVRGYGP